MYPLTGLILAGGKSFRFGTDKALALYEGKRLVERSVDLVTKVGLKPIVVTREGPDYSFLGCSILRDKLPEIGPLGGIYTAMTVFKKTDFLILTCDMPALTPDILIALLSDVDGPCPIRLFSTDSKIQPFPGIYRSEIFGSLSQHLIEGRRSMLGLIEQISGVKIISWQKSQETFLNVNRPEDLVVKGSVF